MQTTKEYTHKLLLETARRAFFKKGFKAVSMREISKLSGIGLSNIYNYYPCKDDLLADVLHLIKKGNPIQDLKDFLKNASVTALSFSYTESKLVYYRQHR